MKHSRSGIHKATLTLHLTLRRVDLRENKRSSKTIDKTDDSKISSEEVRGYSCFLSFLSNEVVAEANGAKSGTTSIVLDGCNQVLTT